MATVATAGQVVTWSEFTNAVLNTLKGVCHNIDSFNSAVPAALRSGFNTHYCVWSYNTTGSGGYSQQNFSFYANSSNLMTIVTSSTVNSEWSTFLSDAGINSRSNKIIQGKDLCMAVNLFQQFMSFHVKPLHCTFKIIDSTVYNGAKYVTGACTPKWTLSAIENGSIPTMTNNDINGTHQIVRESIFHDQNGWGIITAETNGPSLYKCTLA